MSDNGSNSQPVVIEEEEERDREFFNSLRAPSITKESIINLSFDRIKEIRGQFCQLESTVTDLRSTVTDLRSIISGLRQSLERTNRSVNESAETIEQLQTQLRSSNELIEGLKTELAVNQGKAVPSEHQSMNMNTSSATNNSSTSFLINHVRSGTLNVEKPNIKAAQPEPFSGEKARLVNDWLAAVKRYLMLSGAEETKWVAYAVTMLTSTALSWWNSVELSNSEKSILDYRWSEFVDLVRERFVPVDSEAVAMSKMSQWKQTGNVATYISQFQSFDQLIPKERLHEEMRVQMFIQGLKPECKSIINMWEPKTLQQVYKMAQKFDNSQRQSYPKFNQHTSARVNRTQIIDQQEGTRNNPIIVSNAELQTEEHGEDDLNPMNDLNGQRGVCHYCKSPDHYMNVCPKLKKKRDSESHQTSSKVCQSSLYSTN